MRPIVMLVHSLGSGGVTNAAIAQANLFTAEGIDATTVTFDDGLAWRDNVEELRTSGRLSSGARVLNIYQDSRQRASTVPGAPVAEQSETAPVAARLRRRMRSLADRAAALGVVRSPGEFAETGSDEHGRYRRHFAANGDFLSVDRLTGTGAIRYVDHYQDRILSRRDDYHDGEIVRRTQYTPEGVVNQVQFMTADGFCYAQRWVNPKTQRGAGVFIADRQDKTVTRLNSLPDWHVAWLQRLVDSYETPPIVIAETSSTIPKMIRLRRESAVRVAMMHNSHVETPFQVDSPLRSDYEKTYSQLDELDAYVILTEQQRRDMEERLHAHDMFIVVPNVIRIPELTRNAVDPHLVSIVSRIAPNKAIHEAIEAFELVLAEEPEARLEIYGRGESVEELEKLIADRSLGGSVSLKGRTSQPDRVMARSVCTVSTSKTESFGLSIAESLAAGTPVVAYDCLYGPSGLIDDGRTGYLVAPGDKAGVAARIVQLLRDPEAAGRLGLAGRRDVEARLRAPAVMERWRAAFALAEKRSGLGAKVA